MKIMVGVARIELATPAMSTQCSTTELHAHPGIRRRYGRDIWTRALSGHPDCRKGLKPPVLVLGLEQAIDLGDEVLEVERF